VLDAMHGGRTLTGPGGTARFEATAAFAEITELGEPRPLGVEQSNVSVSFSDKVILKIYRRLRAGRQPDVEVARFLTEVANYPNTPSYLGGVEIAGEEPTTLAAAFACVSNQGDAGSNIVEALTRDLDEAQMRPHAGDILPEPEPGEGAGFGFPLTIGGLLGQRTAELHRAFATPTDDPAFALEPLDADDLRRWSAEAAAEAARVMDRLQAARDELPPEVRDDAAGLIGDRAALMDALRAAGGAAASGSRSRIHGDYHLGQVLIAQADVAIIDFEGEPARSLAERRAKGSPLRDVAGMLRSFDYAAFMALENHRKAFGTVDDPARARAIAWRQRTSGEFLDAYRARAEGAANLPESREAADALLRLFLLQKAVYEIGYELGNRPAWVGIPVRGVLDLLEAGSA